LHEDEVEVSDEVLRTIIAEYTREAGVRNLERELGTVLRKTATKIASSQPIAEETVQAAAEDSATPSPDDAAPSEERAPDAEAKPAEGEPQPAKAAKRSKAVKPKTPVKIDLEVVRDALGRQKFFQESAARTATPGVATGLAVTGAGGDVLFVEATAMKGGSGGNSLVLTGQLGDVMKEAARIAPSYV